MNGNGAQRGRLGPALVVGWTVARHTTGSSGAGAPLELSRVEVDGGAGSRGHLPGRRGIQLDTSTMLH